MTHEVVKRSREMDSTTDSGDQSADNRDLDELHLRPSYWPKRHRSRNCPTDLQSYKESLLRQIPVGSSGKEVKLSISDVLNALIRKEPINGTPEQKMLALIELLEELHPSPNPTFETLLGVSMAPLADRPKT